MKFVAHAGYDSLAVLLDGGREAIFDLRKWTLHICDPFPRFAALLGPGWPPGLSDGLDRTELEDAIRNATRAISE